MLSYHNTIDEINESNVDTAILPLGSIEQHGSHLPVGTDYFLAEEMSKLIAEKINAYLLPTLPISTCYENKGKRGSVCMRPITFYQMLQDIIIDLKNQGFKRVIVYSAHGGIFVAAPAIRELNALYDDLQVIKIEGFSNRSNGILESDGIHACELETSAMLYLYNELVKKDLMMQNDSEPDYPKEYLNYAPLIKLSGNGVWGKPSLSTVEKGRLSVEYELEYALNYIEKAFNIALAEKWQKP